MLQCHITDTNVNTDRYIEDRSNGKAQSFCHKAHGDGNKREDEESVPLRWQPIQEVDQYEKDHAQENLRYHVRGVKIINHTCTFLSKQEF